jgi:predicted dehydrogenase
MIEAARKNKVKLMIAYRLHFDEANLSAVEIVQSGKLGVLRVFNSTFTQQVKDGDIRLQSKLGGGTLYDIGIYCINGARYLFRQEPEEVIAFTNSGNDRRFREVEENASAILRFAQGKLAAFTCSFGAAEIDAYEVVGTKGRLRLEPAYEFAAELQLETTIGDKKQRGKFPQHDQFAPELIYFSDCILKNEDPEPSGVEGLADARIIRALYKSAESGAAVTVPAIAKPKPPTSEQEITRPAVQKPKLVNAESLSGS